MRRLAVARCVYGALLVVASGPIVERVTGERSSRAVAVGRLLGARHVLQALTVGRTHTDGWRTAGTCIDALHALSMVFLAGYSATSRRLATFDAVMASAWAASGWLSQRRS
ncbi:hypothetical protein [Halococcus hamelinensis]|uniref:Uncharacterized protein n=1 Tax=Halococcus hamelinensis 100A6 TaxID=1132509 RepID=M0LY80_9EURY|nr:hypothetical protein [Halococcus hamelinensis]EMA38128.1 hypothetical protein C447_10385 [Halococcus hamelinensis 100A6]